MRHPSFPEYCYHFIKQMKKLAQELQFIIYKMQIQKNVKIIQQTLEKILFIRQNTTLTPKETAQCQQIINQ